MKMLEGIQTLVLFEFELYSFILISLLSATLKKNI